MFVFSSRKKFYENSDQNLSFEINREAFDFRRFLSIKFRLPQFPNFRQNLHNFQETNILQINALKLEGTFEIIIKRIGDSRGYFMETYSQKTFAEHGLQTEWVQENQSLSEKKHTVRGLHFQKPPAAQAKLVRVIQGEALDVFVDLRKDSKTYGQWDSLVLSEENCNWVYVPRGFAHGFCTLTQNVIIQYKVDNPYSPEHDSGIRWNDADIGVKWNVENPVLSEKDRNAQFFKDFVSPF